MDNFADWSDEKLIEKILSENPEVYREIIRRYSGKLSRYLQRFIFDSDDLEDVLQAVFIKAYENLFSFDLKMKFSSWIYRIAHNEAIDHIKKNSKIKIGFEELENEIVIDVDLSRSIDRIILKEKVESAFSKISGKFREPLMLFYFDQKSYEEISDILRIPKNTVGALIFRGKIALK